MSSQKSAFKIRPFLFGVFIIIQSCSSQSNKNQIVESIKENARLFLKDKRLNAVSIAVYSKGISHTHHFGELDKGKGNTPTDETLYEIASVTKTMTGYLAAKAVVDKKITLTTPVGKYLGKAYKNLTFKGVPITIKHLLTHTSGLQQNANGIRQLYENPSQKTYHKAQQLLTNYSKASMLNELKKTTIDIVPGTQYSYSNIAPNLLAYILEIVYDKPFKSLIQEHIFDAANMKNSGINLTSKQQSLLANGYNAKGDLMPNFKKPIKLWGAAGRMKSNSADMLNYIKFQLHNENAVIKESRTKLFKDLDNLWIGYFWEIIEDKNGTHIEHHGGIYGTQNWLIIYPKFDFGISVITNSSFPEANQLIKQTAMNIFKDINTINN